jgi:hypothetical protein
MNESSMGTMNISLRLVVEKWLASTPAMPTRVTGSAACAQPIDAMYVLRHRGRLARWELTFFSTMTEYGAYFRLWPNALR